MGWRPVIVAVLLGLLPAVSAADRGALTVEIGPAVTVLRASPSVGTGSGTLGTSAGGTAGFRYGVSNALELAAIGIWESPATYFHSGVEFRTGAGPVHGTLSEKVQRYGAVVGIRLVQGYVWRLHLGVDAGWIRTSFARRDLIDVSILGNEHSFGLGLRDRVSDTLVVAPVAGVEWQLADHWSISVMPRLELLVGGPTKLAAVLPVTVGRSWFLF